MKCPICLAVILAVFLFPAAVFPVDGFPDFITSNEDYYVTRIGRLPDIDEKEYRLEVTGLVEKPGSYTLEQLRAMPMVEIPTDRGVHRKLPQRSFAFHGTLERIPAV